MKYRTFIDSSFISHNCHDRDKQRNGEEQRLMGWKLHSKDSRELVSRKRLNSEAQAAGLEKQELSRESREILSRGESCERSNQ
jgi:hypothetical protein